MFGNDNRTEAWVAAGIAIGLQPHMSCEKYRAGDTFRQMHSRLGARAQGPASISHVLFGLRHGARVMIAGYDLPNELATMGADSGSDSTYWTEVIVELDPPLFTGMRVARAPLLAGLRHGPDVQLGVPDADRALLITALDSEKVRALLRPLQPHDQEFLSSVVKGVADGLSITDSTVSFKLLGRVTDPATLDRFLTAALWYRNELLQRAVRAAELRPHEQLARAQWAEYAASSGLQLDPAQMKLHGVVEGVPIEVALEMAPGRIQTAVTLRWPRSVGVHLRVTKYDLRGHGAETLPDAHIGIARFFTDLTEQDIRVQDAPFDDAFQVQGYPEAHVRQVLASPELRANLVTISKVAHEINMTDEGLSWFIDAPALRAADLDGHVRMAVRTARALHPQVEALAPYR